MMNTKNGSLEVGETFVSRAPIGYNTGEFSLREVLEPDFGTTNQKKRLARRAIDRNIQNLKNARESSIAISATSVAGTLILPLLSDKWFPAGVLAVSILIISAMVCIYSRRKYEKKGERLKKELVELIARQVLED